MSHIKKMVTIQTVTRAKVIQLLGITELQYGDYLMQQAFAYLNDQLGESPMGKELSKNSLFWAWWRNHWHDTDMDFVTEANKMNMQERNMYYGILHDHKTFTYTPQRSILMDAYKTIKPLIKHQL